TTRATRSWGRLGTTSRSAGGHLAIVKLLVEHGAEIKENKEGKIPLQLAQDRGHKDIVDYFESLETIEEPSV
ncbi:MAG: ankyrin repeat domain-containing protein, partial [Bacteroidota bacterium]